MARASDEYVADFETTTDPDDCRVWGYGIATITENPRSTIGHTIDEFLDFVTKDDATFFFHNLAFDGPFIIDWLYRHNYTYTTNDKVRSGEFNTSINIMGKFFKIDVGWFTGVRTVFKDSLKKLPMSVSNVAKAFDLSESKGDIDYHKTRPVGYVMDSQERDYIRRDVEIVARALFQQISEGMTRLTVGSDSLYTFTQMMGKKTFKRMFPILPDSMDRQIRMAYRGGWTYADPRTQGKRIGCGSVYDVNSLYPFVMQEYPMPYGQPVYFDGHPGNDTKHPLFIVSITMTAKIKSNHLPCIQIKGNPFFKPTQWQTDISEPTTVVCSNVDLELWQEHYDLHIQSWNGGFKFKQVAGIFDHYIEKWMEVKANSTGGRRAIAKLFLNSLYGKFATNPIITPKIPVFEDNIVKLKVGAEETRDPVYTPVGVFITAYARRVTITAAQNNYDRFLYADTDSIHLRGTQAARGITVDKGEIGAWKHEYDFTEGMFLRAKQYIEKKTDGTHEVHFAGMPVEISKKLTLDTVKPGTRIGGKLTPKRVPGGIILTETTFLIQ